MVTKAAFGHFGISLIKSILRLTGAALFYYNNSIAQFVLCFAIAEGLGILEEIFDKR